MTLGPVVTGTRLTEHEVIWSEDLAEGAGPHGVHGTRFQVHQDCSWYVLSAGGLIVVNVDALQLEIGISMVGTSGIDTMLIGDDFPEL